MESIQNNFCHIFYIEPDFCSSQAILQCVDLILFLKKKKLIQETVEEKNS